MILAFSELNWVLAQNFLTRIELIISFLDVIYEKKSKKYAEKIAKK